jgi:RNA polymerase sigma-70 factor (ECF subfamily)
MNTHDQQLLQRAQQFETRALVDIFDEHSPGLYRYALRRTGSPQVAEDCVSETFARFLQTLKRRKRTIKTSLRAYLYRTAHNWLIDQFRKEPNPPDELDETITVDHQPGTEQQVETLEQQRKLQEALTHLPPVQQQVIALRYLEEWNQAECAEALGKTVGAVKSLQYRAEENLKKLLKSQEQEI